MKVTGSCHCGAVAYEADVDTTRVGICHCRDCQKLTGSAYRVSVAAAREAFKLLNGTPAEYVKTAESGAKRAQAFCPTCGSPLYTYDVEKPDTYGLRWAASTNVRNLSRKDKSGVDQRSRGP